MSVAFTKEQDGEAAAAHLLDRPVSAHPNLVTEAGLQALDDALAQARADYGAAQAQGDIQADRTAMARATRDLRYYTARRASAQLVIPDPERMGVQFGSRVGFVRRDGRRQTLQIVGEDEADPTAGRVSYVSPMARGLLGADVGDSVRLGADELTVLTIG